MRDADGHPDPRERVDLKAEHGLVVLFRELDDDLFRVVRCRGGGGGGGFEDTEEGFGRECDRDLVRGVGLDAVVGEDGVDFDLSAVCLERRQDGWSETDTHDQT